MSPNIFWGKLPVPKYIIDIADNTISLPFWVDIKPNFFINIEQTIFGFIEWIKISVNKKNISKFKKNFDKSVYSIKLGLFLFVLKVVKMNVRRIIPVQIIVIDFLIKSNENFIIVT